MMDNWIATLLLQIWTGLFGPNGMAKTIYSKLAQILAAVELNRHTELKILSEFEPLRQDFQALQAKVQQILAFLTPPLPVAFVITISADTPEGQALNLERHKSQGEHIMGKVIKATLDFVLNDNGTATATATPIDSAGLPTTLPAGAGTPAWASSAPSVVVTPIATDPTGLSATVTPSTPPVLATAVNVSVSALLADGVTTITGDDLVDVVASAATGFAVAMN